MDNNDIDDDNFFDEKDHNLIEEGLDNLKRSLDINMQKVLLNKEDVESYFITGEQLLLNPINKIPTLIDPIFQTVGVVAIGGTSDTGKSTFLRQLAMALV